MNRRVVYSVFLVFAFLAVPVGVSLQRPPVATVVQPDCRAQVERAVKAEKASLQTRLQKLEELVSQQKTRIGELESKIGNHGGEVNGLRAQLTEVRNEAERLKGENTKLAAENAEMKVRIDSFGGEKKALEDRMNTEIARLTGDRDNLQRQLAAARSAPAGSISSGGNGAELSAAIESKDREIAEAKSLYNDLAGQCIKDPAQILAGDDISKRKDGDTSSEYYVKYENGQRYQARDLLIGTLMFPDPSDLKFKAGGDGIIQVKFKPRALGDNRTQWFVSLKFAKGKIEFPYDPGQSNGELRRDIKPGVDETWVWRTGSVSPAGFEKDLAHVAMVAGYLTPDGERSASLENHPLEIEELVVPGLVSRAWEWFGRNVTILLTILSGILGLVTIYLGIAKSGLETRKAQLELAMAEERSRVTELEGRTSALESQPKPAT